MKVNSRSLVIFSSLNSFGSSQAPNVTTKFRGNWSAGSREEYFFSLDMDKVDMLVMWRGLFQRISLPYGPGALYEIWLQSAHVFSEDV